MPFNAGHRVEFRDIVATCGTRPVAIAGICRDRAIAKFRQFSERVSKLVERGRDSGSTGKAFGGKRAQFVDPRESLGEKVDTTDRVTNRHPVSAIAQPAEQARSAENMLGLWVITVKHQSWVVATNGRFLRHRFSPKPKVIATQNSLPNRDHVAKEAVSAALQTRKRQRSE